MQRPTRGNPVRERSAGVFWSVLSRIEATVFLWNAFPLHLHEPDNPFSNRSHNARERRAGQALLDQLVRFLNPSAIIAIGNDAEKVARRLDGRGYGIPATGDVPSFWPVLRRTTGFGETVRFGLTQTVQTPGGVCPARSNPVPPGSA